VVDRLEVAWPGRSGREVLVWLAPGAGHRRSRWVKQTVRVFKRRILQSHLALVAFQLPVLHRFQNWFCIIVGDEQAARPGCIARLAPLVRRLVVQEGGAGRLVPRLSRVCSIEFTRPSGAAAVRQSAGSRRLAVPTKLAPLFLPLSPRHKEGAFFICLWPQAGGLLDPVARSATCVGERGGPHRFLSSGSTPSGRERSS
jgi:hypothetical protein